MPGQQGEMSWFVGTKGKIQVIMIWSMRRNGENKGNKQASWLSPSDRVPSILSVVPAVLRHPASPRKRRDLTHLTAAVVGRRANALALTDLHAGLGVVGCCGAHTLLDLAGHGQESLLDIAGVLGGSLEEGNSQAVGKFL
jgi:hypothetical protein